MTLTQLRARCEIRDGCWLWQGCMSTTGHPRVAVPGTNQHRSARRAAYELSRNVKTDIKLMPISRCGERACINPRCTQFVDRATFLRLNIERGAVYRDAAINAKIALARQAKSKINMDVARQIRARRAAGETGRSVARDLGISEDSVCLIWRNKQWRDCTNPLAVLVAQMGVL